MTDENEVAPAEATEEVTTEVEEAEVEQESSQEDDGQQPDTEADAEGSEDQSEAKKRRERRKARQAELYQQTEAAKARKERQMAVWEDGVPPKESDYEDPTEYAIDAALYRDRQRQKEVAEKQADSEISELTQQAQTERATFWNEQKSEARSKYQDFDQVALGGHWNPTETMAEVIQTSELGADVAYFLGSNTHIAQQIAQLPPVMQAREMGRIETAITTPKPKTETSAPDPIKPVKPSSNPRKGLQGLSQADYRAARMKEMSNG